MSNKFLREKDLVERLMQRLGLPVDDYEDPNVAGLESGADVVAIRHEKRIGVQVTILDTGDEPGQAIAADPCRW